MWIRRVQNQHSSFDGGFLPCHGSVPTMPPFESNTPMRLQMGVYKVRALPLKMTASVWKLGNAVCLCEAPLCNSCGLTLHLSKSLLAFKNLSKRFRFVNVFLFVVLPFLAWHRMPCMHWSTLTMSVTPFTGRKLASGAMWWATGCSLQKRKSQSS